MFDDCKISWNNDTPLKRDMLQKFTSVAAFSLEKINHSEIFKTANLPREEILSYNLSRHFKSIGPISKLEKNDSSAYSLIESSSFYNSCERYEEAMKYSNSASNAARLGSCVSALALSQHIETISGSNNKPDSSVFGMYKTAIDIIEYQLGKSHPVLMGLHDRMALVFENAEMYQQALGYHLQSLDISLKSLGKQHVITAGYILKAGILHSKLSQTEESIQKFHESRQIFQSLESEKTLIAEVFFHLAEALAARGDNDGAIANCQRARKLREQSYGQYDERTVETYQQLARLLLVQYVDYHGVMTPQIRLNYLEAISCLEKVFRFIKVSKSRKGGNGGMVSGRSTPAHSRSQSTISQRSNFTGVSQVTSSRTAALIHTTGPFLNAPYSPPPIFSRNLLHQLTKQIVKLKLELLENPKHRECIRTLRQEIKSGRIGVGFQANEARQVILQMAAVTPSVYIEGILTRIDEDDDTAVDEMAIVLQLTEAEVFGMN